MKRIFRWFVVAVAILMVVCVLAAAVSAWSNTRLPEHSPVLQNLSDPQKAIMAEVLHLRESLGDELWSGWAQADIPIIVYNEGYVFMVGYPGLPPQGWEMEPRTDARGTVWEETSQDFFNGSPYYYQPLLDPKKTPENFTVRVGDLWAATMQTGEYAEIAFFSGFKSELPVILQPVFPYRLAWKYLFGSPIVYIGGLAHESFHAYQGMIAPERFAAAEFSVSAEEEYPWEDPDLDRTWKEELNLLSRAALAETDAEASDLARQFLAVRDARRSENGLNYLSIDYERQREWLEGLAKYTELSLVRLAATTPDYQPVTQMKKVADFKDYSSAERYFTQQLEEVQRMTNQTDTRFYYSGLAQGVLLDRLSPGWKDEIWQEGVWLEDLLAEALK